MSSFYFWSHSYLSLSSLVHCLHLRLSPAPSCKGGFLPALEQVTRNLQDLAFLSVEGREDYLFGSTPDLHAWGDVER